MCAFELLRACNPPPSPSAEVKDNDSLLSAVHDLKAACTAVIDPDSSLPAAPPTELRVTYAVRKLPLANGLFVRGALPVLRLMANESSRVKRRGVELLHADVKATLHSGGGAFPSQFSLLEKARAALGLYVPRQTGHLEEARVQVQGGLNSFLAAGAPPLPRPLPTASELVLQCPWCPTVCKGTSAYADHRGVCPASTARQASRGAPSRAPQATSSSPASGLPQEAGQHGMYPALAHAAHLFVTTAMPSLIKKPLKLIVQSFVMEQFAMTRQEADVVMHTRDPVHLPPTLFTKLEETDCCQVPLQHTIAAYRTACNPQPSYNNAPARTTRLSAGMLNHRLLAGIELRNHISRCSAVRAHRARYGSDVTPLYLDLLPRLAWDQQPLHIRSAAVQPILDSAKAATLFTAATSRGLHGDAAGPTRLWHGCMQEVLLATRRGGTEASVMDLLNVKNKTLHRVLKREGVPTSFSIVHDEIHLLFERSVYASITQAEGDEEEDEGEGEEEFLLEEMDPEPATATDIPAPAHASHSGSSLRQRNSTGLDPYTLWLRDTPPQVAVRHFDSPGLNRSTRDFVMGKNGLYHLTAVPVSDACGVTTGVVCVCVLMHSAHHCNLGPPHPRPSLVCCCQTKKTWKHWKQAHVIAFDPGKRLLLSSHDRYVSEEVPYPLCLWL